MPMKKGNKAKLIYYSPEEWERVCLRADTLGVRTGTYIRNISVRGEIKNFDMSQFNHLVVAFNRIGGQVNHIVKVANSTQSVYQKDVDDLKNQFDNLQKVFANYLSPIKSFRILEDK